MSKGPQPEVEQSFQVRYEALFRVSRTISVYRDPKHLFRVLADELRLVVDSNYVAVFLYEPASNKVHNVVLETMSGPRIAIPTEFPAEETITWWVYHHQNQRASAYPVSV